MTTNDIDSFEAEVDEWLTGHDDLSPRMAEAMGYDLLDQARERTRRLSQQRERLTAALIRMGGSDRKLARVGGMSPSTVKAIRSTVEQ